MKILFLLCFLSLLTSCGVKAPPVAPEKNSPTTLNLDCSPNDEKCDAEDPNYKPLNK